MDKVILTMDHALPRVDGYIDYFPMAPATNLFHLFQKVFVIPCLGRDFVQRSHFYSYLDSKSYFKCIALLFPFLGSMGLMIFDYTNYREKADALAEVLKNVDALKYVEERLKGDADFMLKVFQQGNMSAFEFSRYCHSSLMEDPDFMLAAVAQDVWFLEYACVQLKGNADFMLKAFQHENVSGWHLFYYCNLSLKEDSDFMLVVAQQDINALSYAGDQLKDEEVFMLEAVKLDGWFLRLATNRLKDDDEFMLEAIEQNVVSLGYASERLKGNANFMLKAFQHENVSVFQLFSCCNLSLREDSEFMLAAIEQNVWSIEYASDPLKNDETFMLEAVQKDGLSLRFASNRIKDIYDVVYAAVLNEPLAFHYAHERLKENNRIRQAAGVVALTHITEPLSYGE